MDKNEINEALYPQKKSRKFIRSYSFKNLKKEIESYGFNYSFKQFLLQCLVYFGLVILIAFMAKLKIQYVAVLIALTLLAMPIIVLSQFDLLYQVSRFDMVVSYLDNIIPVFKNKPVIINALREVVDLVEGDMQEVIKKAINYIEINTDDEEIYKTALGMIEEKFPNTRIHAVHQLMLTISEKNSTEYYDSIDNMFYDVAGWIQRIYVFQKDLIRKKRQLLFLCVLSIFVASIMVLVYASNSIFQPFSDLIGYQISMTVYIALILGLMIMIYVKLNGQWLVDDQSRKIEKSYNRAFDQYLNKSETKPSIPQIIVSILLVVGAGAYYYYVRNIVGSVAFVLLALFVLVYNRQRFKQNKRRVKKALEIEFPVWLRDVVLNLQNDTIVNAIESSKKRVSPIMAYYIDKFMDDISKNPTGIQPFNDFLGEFDLPDVKSSMKILYSMQEIKKERRIDQTNSLIARNQELLAKSDRLKNEDELLGINLLGYIPLMLCGGQMMITMYLMFVYIFNILSNAIQF